MLKKLFRLSSRFEYNVARKHGEHYKGQFFHIYLLKPNSYEGKTKVGIVVSNKIHKNAVRRNKLKRLYREAVRTNFGMLGDKMWIVIQPTSLALEKTYEEISTDFNKTLQKISFLR